VVCACIDIGTNTTRLLVAEPGREGKALRELLAQKVFTRVGRGCAADGSISDVKLAEVCKVVAAQAEAARSLGAVRVCAVATAAIRHAPNRDLLVDAVRDACGLELTVLDGDEEARLAFSGAVRALPEPPVGTVGVVDVGGGSTELAVGTLSEGVTWSRSVPVGSAVLSDTHLHSDPPTPDQLGALRDHAALAFADIRPPEAQLAVAVGGSAASLRRMVGPVLDRENLGRALDLLVAAPAAEVAALHELDPERVHLLPGGLAVLEEASGAFVLPLAVAYGGLREGVVLQELEAAQQG